MVVCPSALLTGGRREATQEAAALLLFVKPQTISSFVSTARTLSREREASAYFTLSTPEQRGSFRHGARSVIPCPPPFPLNMAAPPHPLVMDAPAPRVAPCFLAAPLGWRRMLPEARRPAASWSCCSPFPPPSPGTCFLCTGRGVTPLRAHLYAGSRRREFLHDLNHRLSRRRVFVDSLGDIITTGDFFTGIPPASSLESSSSTPFSSVIVTRDERQRKAETVVVAVPAVTCGEIYGRLIGSLIQQRRQQSSPSAICAESDRRRVINTRCHARQCFSRVKERLTVDLSRRPRRCSPRGRRGREKERREEGGQTERGLLPFTTCLCFPKRLRDDDSRGGGRRRKTGRLEVRSRSATDQAPPRQLGCQTALGRRSFFFSPPSRLVKCHRQPSRVLRSWRRQKHHQDLRDG